MKLKLKSRRSAREEVGAKGIYEKGVETYGGDYLIYFIVKPSNIAVLSQTAVQTKITALTNVIRGLDGAELSCINSRENFDGNKNFYRERMENEKSPRVRELLEKDIQYLDRVQIQTASAREFMFVVRVKNYNGEGNDVANAISRTEKLLKDEGFSARIADKNDIKRLYAVYFVQNITQIYFDDYDGQRWVKGDDYI